MQLSSVLGGHFPDHEVEDPAVFVVGQLQLRVEPHQDRELLPGVGVDLHGQAGREDGGKLDVELLLAGEAEGESSLAGEVLERDDAHPHQVTPVDPLVALRYNSSYPEQERSLGGPVPARATPIIFPRKDDQLGSSLGVLLGSVEHVQLLAGGDVNCLRRGLPDELVDDSDVAEGSSSHDGVVASPGSEAVELRRREAPAVQVPGGGGPPGDRPGRRDVVRRDGVPEIKQSVSSFDGVLHRELGGHPLEEGRALDVGGGGVPGVQDGLRSGELVPVGVAGGDLAVDFLRGLTLQ